jgi:hypothetical protein
MRAEEYGDAVHVPSFLHLVGGFSLISRSSTVGWLKSGKGLKQGAARVLTAAAL